MMKVLMVVIAGHRARVCILGN